MEFNQRYVLRKKLAIENTIIDQQTEKRIVTKKNSSYNIHQQCKIEAKDIQPLQKYIHENFENCYSSIKFIINGSEKYFEETRVIKVYEENFIAMIKIRLRNTGAKLLLMTRI